MDLKHYDVVIAGAGLSGLSVAHFLNKLHPELDVAIFEKASRPGGAIQSMYQQGFLAEWGAHGFLDNVPESRELLEDLGLDQEAQKAPLKQFLRYVSRKGRLVALPQSPGQVIRGRFMPFEGKLRILADLWKKPRTEEQTMAQWAAYRFGPAILPLVDAAVTGTYSGDMEKLSIDAVMPGLRRLELDLGSVIRGALKMIKQGRSANKGSGIPSMVSFKQGMERLVTSLAENSPVVPDRAVKAISKVDAGWKVETEGEDVVARQVVLALQINQSLDLLAPLDTVPVARIPEAKLANVVMGFGPEAKVPFGFGYLAPRTENRFALGALFSSHMFPERAAEGMVLLEALVGGRLYPDRLELTDRELIEKTYNDLHQLIDLPEPPCFARVLRPEIGIPQLELGHLKIQEWREQVEKKLPDLYLCGFGWEGIGMNDMIKKAKAVAEAMTERRARLSEQAEAKGVYF